MELKIEEGIIQRPHKVVIYGPEGIGKTTLASQFPNPIFIDTEGGTSSFDVKRIKGIEKSEDIIEACRFACKNGAKTIVIDTADWLEDIVLKEMLDPYDGKKTSVEDFGYGKGYVMLAERMQAILKNLSKVVDSGAMNVVLTAHAMLRKFEQPDERGAYDRWELKLSKKTSPLVKEWCDCLLFCNYKTTVTEEGKDTKKYRVGGGRRIIRTTHHPCWDAKNRCDMPDEIPMKYEELAKYLFKED